MTSPITLRMADESPYCTVDEQRMATASHSSLRPWSIAAIPLGMRSSAWAASSTLSVSAATPELSRVVADTRFIPFPAPLLGSLLRRQFNGVSSPVSVHERFQLVLVFPLRQVAPRLF